MNEDRFVEDLQANENLVRLLDGIDAFLAIACCVGARRSTQGLSIYAPHGLTDVYDLIVRPNPLRAAQGPGLATAYERKTARWRAVWPKLRVLPWSP